MIELKVKSEMKESSAGIDITAETCIQESLRTTIERVSMQATEQSSHACSNKVMHSTRKNGLITPWMQPTLEAESVVGDEVRGVVEDILMAKSFAIKSPRFTGLVLSYEESKWGCYSFQGVTGKKKVSFDIVDHCTPTSTVEFVPNVPNAVDVLVVHDDVHKDVDRAKLEKGTFPTPTTVESSTDAIVDAMVVDACTDAIADATIVDACTNDIVDAMEVDASTDAATDGNVNDDATVESGTDATVDDMVVDACTDAIGDATIVDACTNDIVDAMEVDASTDVVADGNVNDGGSECIVQDVIDSIPNAVEAKGMNASIEDTRGMGEEALIEREAGTHEVVGASDVTAQAKVVCQSDAANDITDVEEAKGTAVVEDIRGLGEEDLTKRVVKIGSVVGNNDVAASADTVEAGDRVVQSGEAMGEAVMAATDMK
ncbi:hypothetical protein L7F22_024277 [Adiantum nelumboides]|nr:hypothetical protein [Adiantum nelumboides]